jgi:hypothetical protein
MFICYGGLHLCSCPCFLSPGREARYIFRARVSFLVVIHGMQIYNVPMGFLKNKTSFLAISTMLFIKHKLVNID